ncbi:hypothetical protein F511_33148 [Dorcoceras hygrometricum]|uniref:DNA-directed RNA polymerase V subunit 1 n=1 Tax=Dorcoceras hygrometricum TaxID=472368 RepID=A0A2Z7B8D8_9LAMI|nr:hypothetical protein F511_33148 [Dorcoceras hygrometricum]
MSLFDLQDVCIAIGSIATLDLPMVVDLIGIYGLKGPYCTLTMTNWFLQELSVIPRGSWGDVSRRSYHDPMVLAAAPSLLYKPPPPPSSPKNCFRPFDEENPSAQISSRLLVQGDEGVSYPVVDRIGVIYRNLPRRADVIVTTVGARHKCQQVAAPPLFNSRLARRRRRFAGIRSGQFDEENPSAQISSRLLVQGDEGVSYPVVDRIGVIYRNLPRRADVIVTTVGARHKCQQGGTVDNQLREAYCVGNIYQSQSIPVANIPVAEYNRRDKYQSQGEPRSGLLSVTSSEYVASGN